MTNEEHVEEILIEAHKLGLTSKVFELVKSLANEHTGSRAFGLQFAWLRWTYGFMIQKGY